MSELRELGRALRDPLTAAFVGTLLISLIRAPQQPSVTISAGSTSISVNPSDVALVLLGVWTLVRIVRRRDLPRHAWPVLIAAAVFSVWLLGSAAANGASAFVAAGKLIEIGAIAVCAVYVLDRRDGVWVLVLALVAMNVAADISALKGFITSGERQRSFLGSHDLAALGTMTLSVWFAHLYAGAGRFRRLAWAAGIAGAIGFTLGAVFASLVGLYLATAAIIVVALLRSEFRARTLVVTAAVVLAITGGVLELRSDNLSFLRAWFGTHSQSNPAGAEHGSWSQRLIFAYMGGRIFLARPVFGTGWYPELPPKEYARFLPDAHRRYPLQPADLFPPADGKFIPQMTYDQVLYELGVCGAILFAILLVLTVRASAQSGRRRPRDDPDPVLAYIAPSWTASILGVLAGIGLFGGASVTTLFWLTLGVAAALAPSLSRPPR
jgi:hypothetical protein